MHQFHFSESRNFIINIIIIIIIFLYSKNNFTSRAPPAVEQFVYFNDNVLTLPIPANLRRALVFSVVIYSFYHYYYLKKKKKKNSFFFFKKLYLPSTRCCRTYSTLTPETRQSSVGLVTPGVAQARKAKTVRGCRREENHMFVELYVFRYTICVPRFSPAVERASR